MFSNKDEYKEATEKASINQHGKGSIFVRYKLGIFNLFLLTTIGVMGYVSLDSLKDESSFLNGISILNKSENREINKNDSEILEILSSVNIESVDSHRELESLSLAINNVVNNSNLSDNSLYTKALSREIGKEEGMRTIVVQKGDTLATLALKYYGDSSSYDKIISNNSSLNSTSHTIFTGQKLNLPY